MRAKKSLAPLIVGLILVLLSVFWLLFIISTSLWGSSSDDRLKEIHSKILCTKCGMNMTIDVCQCPMAPELRERSKILLEEGFSAEEIIWNFNADNISFIYQLPQEVIRGVKCPCACRETLEVCLAELRIWSDAKGEKTLGCPVIDTIREDIRGLQKEGKSNQEIMVRIEDAEHQAKYETIIDTAIKAMKSAANYDFSDLPDAILDDTECGCSCTETLRTCLEEMPWCDRVYKIIHHVTLFMMMGLTAEEAAASMYAPCGKTCGKQTTGIYLGINCDACGRPIRDKAYYGVVSGEKRAYCCESCYKLNQKLPDAILDNVRCKVCPCGMTLRNCKCKDVPVQKMLINTWLMEGKTPGEIIERFRSP